ncbi:ogr/Delta-like zinc finger family protein [Oceanobacter sp. 4_MG-2023]|uniref:ogr/Delta-like zinc finger family protein n=1 Tax=Oceanobacter sp. 4_MG-2023 TaxID=3062623 RepID=UPI0027350697|nr:ogr/Delta-like zinc finger family protein [Oceanobacter sp. 4_MG-2023]MDP2548886.1 ogr/Delta-like zinc finger family protein [Oceanobacter sp. 4_MG-2023]
MRIKCPCCGKKATVYSRALTTDDVNSVYARCVNTECQRFDHSFVSHVAFSHWIDPKAAAMQMTLTHLFDQLPASDRMAMAAELSARV